MIQAYNNKNLFYDFMYLYHFIQTISTFFTKVFTDLNYLWQMCTIRPYIYLYFVM